jgi:uncharacterized membrane protein
MRKKFTDFGSRIPFFYAPLLAAAALVACGSKDLGKEPFDQVLVDEANPTWEADIQVLMNAKCMNCHADPKPKFAPLSAPALNLADSATFNAHAAQIKFRVLDDKVTPMPPTLGTPLTDREKNALKNYFTKVLPMLLK